MLKFTSLSRLIIPAIAAGLLLTACDRRTPDERLATAIQFAQQGDAASAEMEALKVVEKAPDDPAGVRASVLLAQIYMQQNRLEEAQMQLKGALDKVSQLDPMGKDVLQLYLGTLISQKKFDDAFATMDKYQKEYAEDAGTSLSLRVARADLQTNVGKTTAARAALTEIMSETTSPAEMSLYRDLYLKTFLADNNTTAALDYLKAALDKVESDDEKLQLFTRMSSLAAAQDDYPQSRQYLQQATDLLEKTMQQQHDAMAVAASAMQLGQIYMIAGNLPGAEKVFTTLYESPINDPSAVQIFVNSLMGTQLRLGETSATIELLTSAAEKHPQGPFKQALTRMQEAIEKGELQKMAPMDTSTLTMKYKADPQILWPEQLPAILQKASSLTTGTATAGASTSATMQTAPPAEETSYSAVQNPAAETDY